MKDEFNNHNPDNSGELNAINIPNKQSKCIQTRKRKELINTESDIEENNENKEAQNIEIQNEESKEKEISQNF